MGPDLKLSVFDLGGRLVAEHREHLPETGDRALRIEELELEAVGLYHVLVIDVVSGRRVLWTAIKR